MRVAYLGPQGTFSHEMAARLYPDAELVPCESLSQVVQSVSPECDAVLPVENSSNGSVRESIDALCASSTAFVHGSSWLPIHHYYYDFGRPQVSRIYSHPQVWGQVTRFLESTSAERIDCESTAAALIRASADPQSAAIASQHAGRVCNLEPVPGSISDHDSNRTHFMVLRAAPAAKKCARYLVQTDSDTTERTVDALQRVCVVAQPGPRDRVFGTLS